MPNVLNEFAGDGVTRTFNFSMTGGYLSRDFVVFLTRPSDALLDYTPYTGTVVWVSDFTVEVSDPIPVGTTFVITRRTQAEALIDFQNTSRITEHNLDTAFGQSLHRTVELDDLTERRMRAQAALTEDAVEAAAGAEVAARDSANAASLAQSLAAAAELSAAAAHGSAQASAESAAAAELVADEALDLIQQAIKGNVDSFNGRDGAVVPQAGDYSPQMVGFVPGGYIVPEPGFPDVPAWGDTSVNTQAQALTNRTELLNTRLNLAVLYYQDYAAASSAAATLPDGQFVAVLEDQDRYKVESGALVRVTLPVVGSQLIGYDGGAAQDVLDNAKPIANYTALRNYTGRATGVRITAVGIAGYFRRDDSDTTTADNGGTVIVDAEGRRWKRIYDAGAVHADWFGAKASPGSDAVNVTAILAAHNYCAGQARDKKVMFGAGAYPFNSTLPLRGIVEWEGAAPGAVGTTLEWTGSAAVALSLDPADWPGNYQGTFRKIRIARNALASRAVVFDMIRCSEYEFQDVYLSDMGSCFRFKGAPLVYFDRLVTADCDNVFEYTQGDGLFVNAFHVISRCNFWQTNDSVFKFTSGEVYSLFFHDNWVERFGTFIKDGQGDAYSFSMKDFRIRDCHLLSVDTANTRLIWYKAKPGNIISNITRVSFQNTIVALNSSDHICLIDNNGNTAAGTNMFSELSFHDVHAYGAPTALVSSNKYGTTVRVTGDTLAQQGYYFGNMLIQAHNQARPYETNRPQFFAANWTSDGTTQPSLGNGAIDSSYVVESGKVTVKVTVNFGTTTVQGNGVWKFSIPHGGAGAIVGAAFLQVPGTANYACTVTGNAANGYVSLALNTNGNLVPFGVTTNSMTSLTFEYSYTVN